MWEEHEMFYQLCHWYYMYINLGCDVIPVKYVTHIFLCLFNGSLVKNETKYDENPIIFVANAVEIPWLELVQNPCHFWARQTNKTCMNDVALSLNSVYICDMKWHEVFTRIHVTFFTEYVEKLPFFQMKNMRPSKKMWNKFLLQKNFVHPSENLLNWQKPVRVPFYFISK